jgi:hypothetical protein
VPPLAEAVAVETVQIFTTCGEAAGTCTLTQAAGSPQDRPQHKALSTRCALARGPSAVHRRDGCSAAPGAAAAPRGSRPCACACTAWQRTLRSRSRALSRARAGARGGATATQVLDQGETQLSLPLTRSSSFQTILFIVYIYITQNSTAQIAIWRLPNQYWHSA